MKKILSIIILTLALSLSLTACQKPQKVDTVGSLLMSESTVANRVKGWAVYTNPMFRYELRQPKHWEMYVADEYGYDVTFYPSDKFLSDEYNGSVRIVGTSNWREQYTLEQFYEQQKINLFNQDVQTEEFEFRSYRSVWFKEVSGLYANMNVDVIAIDLKDRILEIYLLDDDELGNVLFNSISFYGTKAISQPVDHGNESEFFEESTDDNQDTGSDTNIIDGNKPIEIELNM